MYIYTPLCRYWIALYRHVLVFIVPHVDIELEDNKQFISNIPRKYIQRNLKMYQKDRQLLNMAFLFLLFYFFFYLFIYLLSFIYLFVYLFIYSEICCTVQTLSIKTDRETWANSAHPDQTPQNASGRIRESWTSSYSIAVQDRYLRTASHTYASGYQKLERIVRNRFHDSCLSDRRPYVVFPWLTDTD